MKRFIFFLLLISNFFIVKATKIDNLQISLLTIVPHNNAVYTIYGHTALRIYNLKHNIDIVFNWGTFDFNAPNFLYHFIKGETNYFLSTNDYDQFIQYYNSINTTVIEQILFLTPKNKESFFQILSLNLMPENRTYCYNFLKKNCTTHIRNIIEKVIGIPLEIHNSFDSNTVRQLIHYYSYPCPWISFGIDLIIGSSGDLPIYRSKELFLPMQLKNILDNFIYSSKKPIVISSHKILQSNCKKKYIHFPFFYSPLKTNWLIFYLYGIIVVLTVILKIYKKQKSRIYFKINKIAKICFAILFILIATVGCFIMFFVLFSNNPCVSPNWNLFWLHPFHFIGFVGYFLKKSFYCILLYHWCNIVILLSFLLGKFWIPQSLNIAISPFICCLILGSLFYLIYRSECKVIKNYN